MNSNLEDVYAALADDHKRIFDLVGRLEEMQEPFDLLPALEQLHDLLVDHFSLEQFPGGLYEHLATRGHEHRDQLKVLIREHCEILTGVGGLVVRARAAGLATNAELREEIARVVEALKEHEHKEHLLAQSLLRDE